MCCLPRIWFIIFIFMIIYVTVHANRGGILCFWPGADANLLTCMTLATGYKLDTKLSSKPTHHGEVRN